MAIKFRVTTCWEYVKNWKIWGIKDGRECHGVKEKSEKSFSWGIGGLFGLVVSVFDDSMSVLSKVYSC